MTDIPEAVLKMAREAVAVDLGADRSIVLSGKYDAWPSVQASARAIMAAQAEQREKDARLIEEGFEKAVGESYAPGSRSKNDKCPHGRVMYEDCDQCCADAIRKAP